jgi:serine/threonine-protein kinase
VKALTSSLTLGKKLGNGHFGEVFEGEDPVHRKVAVKVLTRDDAARILEQPSVTDAEWAEFKGDFHSEARNLARARHRNVVQVHHILESDDGSAILFCMELCPRGSLQSRFESGPCDLRELRDIGVDVLLGLDVLHRREMLHRDIKPANVLIGRDRRFKVGDFGLVTDRLILGYGSQAGYSDHIAYEVWHGSGTSVRSDIWAFGMTLYRLLHGKQWYDQLPRPADLVEHGHFVDTLPWLPHVPKAWRRAIRKMMNDDPARRFASAAQAMDCLALLPVEPAWEATVSANQVLWTLNCGSRVRHVEWLIHSPRKHAWRAWSAPVASGRTMTLGGSDGVVSKREAIRQLERYFGE